MNKRCSMYSIAFIAIGLLIGDAQGNAISKGGSPPTLPPCPKDCPIGVYKCQEIKIDAVLLKLLVLTYQIPIKLSVGDIIYANCVYPNGKPIPEKALPEIAAGGAELTSVSVADNVFKGSKPPPPCTSKCPVYWKYVCCANKLLVLHTSIPEIGPIPAIKNVILLCKGLNITVSGN